MAASLGSYAIEAEPDLFMARERVHPTGQLDLPGDRFATCQETDDGRRLDVAAVTPFDQSFLDREDRNLEDGRASELPILPPR